MHHHEFEGRVRVPVNSALLDGTLCVPAGAQSVVLFAYRNGSSRRNPGNNFLTQVFQISGLGTLLVDLITEEEDASQESRSDVDLLAERLEEITRWLRESPQTRNLNVGYFGTGIGAAAALQAASSLGVAIGAVVSRSGRPDLAISSLEKVVAPTLLIVGGRDEERLDGNKLAYERLRSYRELVLIHGASHFLEEPGAPEEVALIATDWFRRHLDSRGSSAKSSWH